MGQDFLLWARIRYLWGCLSPWSPAGSKFEVFVTDVLIDASQAHVPQLICTPLASLWKW